MSDDKEYYIVLGSNSSHQVQAFGTRTGKPFTSEANAEKAARKLERDYPHLDGMAIRIDMFPEKLGG